MMKNCGPCNSFNHRIGICLSGLLGSAIVLMATGCSHNSVDDYLTRGDQAMQNTRLAEAETDYQQAARIAPNDARPHFALGNLYVFEHKPRQAESELMKALELEPNNAKTHAALAGAYKALSQPGMAEAQSRAAVALDPANPEYRMNLGATLQTEQKLVPAEAEYRTALGLEPRNAHTHLALANLLSSEPNRQDEAQSEFAQVKALDPSLMPTTSVGIGSVPEASPSPATSAATETKVAPLKEFNRRFLLTHDSPVYESMSNGAHVVAQVHHGKWVRVTGMAGPWFRIQLRNGTVGFIPVTSAE
jgi:tetratricopeptide (TPR) repeat protein